MAEILLNINSATLRLILRVYFFSALLAASVFGKNCCDSRVRLKILTGRPLDLRYMTGWFSSVTDIAAVVWSLRASPCGWLGWMMTLVGLIWIAGDLAVAGLVVSVQTPTRCAFNTTGLYTVTQLYAHPDASIVEPSPIGPVYNMISNARTNSLTNGGLGGIYRKVNGDANFRAEEADVLGGWKCEDLGVEKVYPVGSNVSEVLSDLQTQGLLFTGFFSACDIVHANAGYGEAVLWTQSEALKSDKPWNFRAAVERSTVPSLQGQQVYMVYECRMNASAVEPILAQTQVDWNISPWCLQLQQTIVPASVLTAPLESDPALAMEAVLDAVVMMAGSAWNLTQAPITDPTQGCLDLRARVSWLVVLLFILATAVPAVMGIYWMTLNRAKRWAAKAWPPDTLSAVDSQTPRGLVKWMRQSVRASSGVEVSAADLKGWTFGFQQNGSQLGLMRN